MRFATYNASLSGKTASEIRNRLSSGVDSQAEKVAAVVQTIRPDLLLITDLDYDADVDTAKLLAEKFFSKPQGARYPIEYPYIYSIPSNTGIDSGLDLNNNGNTGEPDDAWGYGAYPGQHGMAIFSRYRIIKEEVRTFQKFLWKDMPDAKRSIDPETGKPYYDDDTWNVMRLSRKNHVDVPLMVIGRRIHILASDPTPPAFGGKANRNSGRNHDEIKFWLDYLKGDDGEAGEKHIVDDAGKRGGVDADALVVVMGRLSVDPDDGEGDKQAIKALLSHPRLQDPIPTSEGAVGSKADSTGTPARDTASFRSANLRVDYVLPDHRMHFRESRVYHGMVWIKVAVP